MASRSMTRDSSVGSGSRRGSRRRTRSRRTRSRTRSGSRSRTGSRPERQTRDPKAPKMSTQVVLAQYGLEEYFPFLDKAGYRFLDTTLRLTDGQVEHMLTHTEEQCGIQFMSDVRMKLWKALRHQWFKGPGHEYQYVAKADVPKLFLPKIDYKQVDSMIPFHELEADRQRQVLRQTRRTQLPSRDGPALETKQFEVYRRESDVYYEYKDIQRSIVEWTKKNPRSMLKEDQREEVLKIRVQQIVESASADLHLRLVATKWHRVVVAMLYVQKGLFFFLFMFMLYLGWDTNRNLPAELVFPFFIASPHTRCSISFLIAFCFTHVVVSRDHADPKVSKFRRMLIALQRLKEMISDFRVDTEKLRMHRTEAKSAEMAFEAEERERMLEDAYELSALYDERKPSRKNTRTKTRDTGASTKGSRTVTRDSSVDAKPEKSQALKDLDAKAAQVVLDSPETEAAQAPVLPAPGALAVQAFPLEQVGQAAIANAAPAAVHRPQLVETKDCVKCGKPPQTMCGQCQVVKYCSRECQKAHWAEHKLVCHAPGSPPPAIQDKASSAGGSRRASRKSSRLSAASKEKEGEEQKEERKRTTTFEGIDDKETVARRASRESDTVGRRNSRESEFKDSVAGASTQGARRGSRESDFSTQRRQSRDTAGALTDARKNTRESGSGSARLHTRDSGGSRLISRDSQGNPARKRDTRSNTRESARSVTIRPPQPGDIVSPEPSPMAAAGFRTADPDDLLTPRARERKEREKLTNIWDTLNAVTEEDLGANGDLSLMSPMASRSPLASRATREGSSPASRFGTMSPSGSTREMPMTAGSMRQNLGTASSEPVSPGTASSANKKNARKASRLTDGGGVQFAEQDEVHDISLGPRDAAEAFSAAAAATADESGDGPREAAQAAAGESGAMGVARPDDAPRSPELPGSAPK
eukprot:TRINITY_DN7335_c1_g1_i1.p1 TRINITY_DN7335_c1_g1~~TRINITY_DN7335_c1_g1_i1.p1  ORF type:complete len:927 (-),score=169.80 TRINITY_DN7335_c1_g1_i1:91-2871(-)